MYLVYLFTFSYSIFCIIFVCRADFFQKQNFLGENLSRGSRNFAYSLNGASHPEKSLRKPLSVRVISNYEWAPKLQMTFDDWWGVFKLLRILREAHAETAYSDAFFSRAFRIKSGLKTRNEFCRFQLRLNVVNYCRKVSYLIPERNTWLAKTNAMRIFSFVLAQIFTTQVAFKTNLLKKTFFPDLRAYFITSIEHSSRSSNEVRSNSRLRIDFPPQTGPFIPECAIRRAASRRYAF